MLKRDISPGLIRRVVGHGRRPALLAGGEVLSYEQLLEQSALVAAHLLGGESHLAGARVAFLAPPGLDWVRAYWGIWRAGGIAVPLCPAHPAPELEHVLADSDATTVIAHPEFESRLRSLAGAESRRFVSTREYLQAQPTELPRVSSADAAMILYTSGTTSRPKGVLTTHGQIRAQVESLIEAWGWSQQDRILLVLPLHHLHGIINVLGCALAAGASCRIHPTFDARRVWEAFCEHDLTLFMAVPTIYSRLIRAWEEAGAKERRRWSEACGALRLMVSGSAALPLSVLDRWREISGHTLLERYGMTETGMILSSPLDGLRQPGRVGVPLPGVEVKLVGDSGEVVVGAGEGEIYVRGPGVFVQYWRRAESTREAFSDGWFRTGDVARFDGKTYRMLGRKNLDIIKTGGYKVSALEIEEVLRTHPGVRDCSVVGVPDEEWGERVSAAIVVTENRHVDAEEMRMWAKERLAPYKVPQDVVQVDSLPRNVLGKVTKTELKKRFQRPVENPVVPSESS